MKKFLLPAVIFFLTGNLDAATFTSNVAAGNWNVAGSWTVVGVDADGIPDLDDDVTIQSGHNITLMALSDCRDLVISSGGTLSYNGKQLRIRSDYTRNGSTIGTGTLYFYGNPGVIDVGTAFYTNAGNWYFINGSNYSITANSKISKINYFYIQGNALLTNNGNVSLGGGSVSCGFASGYTAGVNSTLLVGRPLVGSNYIFSAAGNTMKYSSNFTSNILRTTYHNLELYTTTASTKTWTGGTLTINGNLLINTNVTLDWAGQSINLKGNWTNTANITCLNIGTLTFNGSGTQTITRTGTETFADVDVSTTGTVVLANSTIATGTTTLSSGTFNPSTFAYQQKGATFKFAGGTVNTSVTGSITFNGTVAQSVTGAGVGTFGNVIVNNAAGVSITNSCNIYGVITVSTGDLGTSGGGVVTLVATGPTTNAKIGVVSGSLSGTNWIIQSYINGPATAYWQYLGTPINGNTLADWDNDTRFWMSGVGGNDGNACCPIFRSVRTYVTATNTYTNITSTGTALTAGKGYMVWMADNLNSLTGPLVYDSRGLPNFGNKSFAVTSGGAGAGYNLVSNPYACPINYASVVAASGNLNASFVILQENGSYATNPNGGTIAANQGFMCIATASGNINFTEACKNTAATPNIIRDGGTPNYVRIKAGNEVSGLGEEAIVWMSNDGDYSFDNSQDLPYLPSPYENATHIYTSNENGDQFLLNNVGNTDANISIPFTVISSTPGNQTLSFKGLSTVTDYNCAWLEDLKTGQRISLNSTDVYTFEEMTMGTERKFILHFEKSNDCSFDLQSATPSLEAQTNVYVNSGQIFAQFEFAQDEMVQISMYDINGRVVMGDSYYNVSNSTITLDTPLSHGIYLVKIVKGSEVTTKKIYY